MKYISKKSIVGAVVIIALVAGGWNWYRSRERRDDSKDISHSSEAVKGNGGISDTSQWEMYKDEKLRFEVKYPGDIYRVDNENITFSGVRFVPINNENIDKYGEITVFIDTLDAAIFTGKTPEEIALFKKEKHGEPLSWKDAYMYGGMRWPRLSADGIELNKRFFYTGSFDNPEMVGECPEENSCKDIYGMQLFTPDRMFSINSNVSTSKNPVYRKFLDTFKPLN